MVQMGMQWLLGDKITKKKEEEGRMVMTNATDGYRVYFPLYRRYTISVPSTYVRWGGKGERKKTQSKWQYIDET